MRTAYIMRGIPGSGKTHVANKIAGDVGFICSTDYFFMENGVYKFDPGKLAFYHRLNLIFFELALANNVPIVICDNTNIRKNDYAPYVEAAKRAGYQIKIISISFDPEQAMDRCIHSVPRETIKRMFLNFEK